MSTPRLLVVASLLLACNRPTLPADGGTTTSQSSTVAGSESTGSGESSESDSNGESSDITTMGFVPESDVIEEEGECDNYAQDCPEGEKCVPYASTGGSWDASKCVPVLGDQEPGEPCHYAGVVDATDDCDATSVCWDVMDVDGELIGTCAPLCLGARNDPQCPEFPGCADYYCNQPDNGALNLCALSCDPLAQDCGAEQACYWTSINFSCSFAVGDLPIGEVCGFINDCVVGSGCVAFELLPDCAGAACCTPFCDPTALVDPCPGLLAGTSCVLFEEPQQGDCAIGRCLAPP